MDDGEPGAGRAILQAIKDHGSKCIAVYVVRYYGGIKLGKRRFEIVSMLTTAALSALRFKTGAKRAMRRERAVSQESIASSISAISSEEDDGLLPLTISTEPQEQASIAS